MATKKQAKEELINHFGLVRLRVAGVGQLNMTIFSLDDVHGYVMVPLTLITPNSDEPTRLCNLTQQRAQLELKTIGMDNVFTCSKIVIFVKPVANSYPG